MLSEDLAVVVAVAVFVAVLTVDDGFSGYP
jgi:hypothetical protein